MSSEGFWMDSVPGWFMGRAGGLSRLGAVRTPAPYLARKRKVGLVVPNRPFVP